MSDEMKTAYAGFMTDVVKKKPSVRNGLKLFLAWGVLSFFWIGFFVYQSWDYLTPLFLEREPRLVRIETEVQNDPAETPEKFAEENYHPYFEWILPTDRPLSSKDVKRAKQWFPSFTDKSEFVFRNHLYGLIARAAKREEEHFKALAVDEVKEVFVQGVIPPFLFLFFGYLGFAYARR